MTAIDIDAAMMDPAATFGTPEALEESAALSREQKHALLLQWKDQLQQLLVATEENMPGPGTAGDLNADCLQRIVDALTRLDRGYGSHPAA
jgi:hypothetical protein